MVRNTLFRQIPLLCLFLFFSAMVGIGSLPGQASNLSAHVNDKLLHFSTYAVMTALAFYSINARTAARIVVSIALIGSLGLVDETIQYFLPYRNASITDWCFDVAAAVVVTFFLGLRNTES